MNRGFNNVYHGNNRSSFGGQNFKERADRSDRRYDDFYADRNRGGRGRGGSASSRGRGGRYIQNKSWDGFTNRPGDKRKSDGGQRFSPSKKTRESPRKEDKEQIKMEELPDIPDDEVVVPDALMDAVETLRQRKEVERNAADEDVQKLLVFCFNGKGYQCKTCGLLLTKQASFLNHLNSKSHVMGVIEARTAKRYQDTRNVLDIDLSPDDWFEQNEMARAIIMKQSKMHMRAEREQKARDEANYNRMPSNFFNFNMELRKSVIKKEEKVVITSLVESSVEVTDFTGDRFFGCEFVRAVTGFHCRLCSINIREAKGVIPHIDSKQHKNNYAAYVKRNPDYEKSQKEQSKDLHDVMEEHEGKSIVLAESSDVSQSHFLCALTDELVRIPTVMNPELKKKEKEEKEKKEKEEDKEKQGNEKEKVENDKTLEDEKMESVRQESTEEKDSEGDTEKRDDLAADGSQVISNNSGAPQDENEKDQGDEPDAESEQPTEASEDNSGDVIVESIEDPKSEDEVDEKDQISANVKSTETDKDSNQEKNE